MTKVELAKGLIERRNCLKNVFLSAKSDLDNGKINGIQYLGIVTKIMDEMDRIRETVKIKKLYPYIKNLEIKE